MLRIAPTTKQFGSTIESSITVRNLHSYQSKHERREPFDNPSVLPLSSHLPREWLLRELTAADLVDCCNEEPQRGGQQPSISQKGCTYRQGPEDKNCADCKARITSGVHLGSPISLLE